MTSGSLVVGCDVSIKNSGGVLTSQADPLEFTLNSTSTKEFGVTKPFGAPPQDFRARKENAPNQI